MSEAKPKSLCHRDDAMAVVRQLRENGHVAYFAGGCVRDLLMGMEPKDYDVATDAPPERVRQLFRNTQAVGAAFGVILVRQGKSVVEVATFRTDVSYADGRRPEGVIFSNPEQDAQRRDFTINGLFLDPLAQSAEQTISTGTSDICGSAAFGVIDFVGGLEDLEKRVLRAIGRPEHRFAEDHLRLLRAVRFAARFDLTIEPATAEAIKQNARFLIRISPERIAEELRMMLIPPTRRGAWRLLWEFALPQVILRDLPEKPEISPGNDSSLLLQLPISGTVPFGLALAAMVLDYRRAGREAGSITVLLDKTAAHQSMVACRRDLKISNDEAEMMKACLTLAWLFADQEPGVAAMKRFLAGPYAAEARAMLSALAHVESGLRDRIGWLEKQFAEFLTGEVAPPPLITGDDLLAAGLSPGPLFKRILQRVYDAQLENMISDKTQAMQMAIGLAEK